MRLLRQRLTYANVVATLALFLVLTGGAALAAHQLSRRSVGSPQLKSNAVTTAKIKANAVTTRKIKKEAISTVKLKNASVNAEKIDLNNVPFARVVSRMRGAGSVSLENNKATVFPLSTSSYTQAGDEVDSYVGQLGITFSPTCEPPREAQAYIVVDSPNPTELKTELEISSIGAIGDVGTGTVSKKIEISPFYAKGISFEPGSPKSHNVSLLVKGKCKTGEGVTATSGAVDVIGTR